MITTKMLPDGRRSRDFSFTALLTHVLIGLGRRGSHWSIGRRSEWGMFR